MSYNPNPRLFTSMRACCLITRQIRQMKFWILARPSLRLVLAINFYINVMLSHTMFKALTTFNLIISTAILPGLLALAFIVHTVLWNYVHCEHLFHYPWYRAHSIMIHHPVFPTNDDKKLPPPSSDDSFGFPLPQGLSKM